MSKCRSAAAARLLLSTLSTLVLPAAWAVTQPEFDCPARQLAFEQASKLMADGPLAAGLKDVHDALQLSAACNATFDAPPAQRPEQQQQQQRWPSDVDGSALLATLHVATTGDDTGADGSAAKPYATLRAARDAARARNDGPGGLVVGTIAISAGRYELTETLTLGAEKSVLFWSHFHDRFTKTGSGQTQGKLREKGRFRRAGGRRRFIRRRAWGRPLWRRGAGAQAERGPERRVGISPSPAGHDEGAAPRRNRAAACALRG